MRYLLLAPVVALSALVNCPPANPMVLAMTVVGPGALSRAGRPATYTLTIGAGAKPPTLNWTPGTPITIQDDNGVVLSTSQAFHSQQG
jgi:hypothetical protein